MAEGAALQRAAAPWTAQQELELMMTIRKSAERGPMRTDWLDSRHTFSFGGYRDDHFAR